MGAKLDITGERYGKLVALKPAGKRNKYNATFWLFKCDCGNEKEISLSDVRAGKINSCGCLLHPHGMEGSRLYYIWSSMKQRCNNTNHKSYKDYGGRGITICAEWKSNFISFRDWAFANGYKEHLTIERIDTNGNYCPANCTWATVKEQANNRRNTIWLTHNGETKTMLQWAEVVGIPYYVLSKRRLNKWDDERLLTTPWKQMNKSKQIQGEII